MRTALVERARNGDDDAFTQLVDMDGDRCYAIAYRILRDVDRAKDAVQQAFLLAWRELPRLRDLERFEVWLYRRHKRWTTHVRILPMEGPSAPDQMGSVEERDALERAFRRLSPEHRAVFVMHHHAGLPLAAISEVVGVPLGTVKSRLHNSIRNLRAALESESALERSEARTA